MAETRLYHHGVPIDQVTEAEALKLIEEQLGTTATAKQIITINNETYSHARRTPGFRCLLNQSWLVINESYGLSTYSRVIRPKLTKIPMGVYLAEKIVDVSSKSGKRVVLVGSTEEDRTKAANQLKERLKDLEIEQVEGDYSFSRTKDSRYVVDELRRLEPDFVVFGGNEIHSQQWIHNHIVMNQNPLPCIIGNFGATIGYWAGNNEHWRPREQENRWYTFVHMYKHRTTERRSRWRRSLANMVILAVEDMLHIDIEQKGK